MKEFRLGVLLVHGIGTPPPRDTLVRWGDVLLKVIGQATKTPGEIVANVSQASAGDRSGESPAEMAVDIRCGDKTERWLLAEGWWAGCFPAPTYSELVSWSFRAGPWAIALHIAQSYWQIAPKASKAARLWAYTKAAGTLLGAMALVPVFMIPLALTLLLGLLPIPQLRSLILSMQSMLIGTVGDSLAFVESPLRAALIRGRILEGLERLQRRCERTVIVAHSQGAAATLDALGGIAPYRDETRPEPPSRYRVPDTLVTFGSGVNQLVSLKVLSAGLPEKINPASAAVWSVLGMIGALIFVYVSIRSGSIAAWDLGKAMALYLLFTAGLTLLLWGVDRLFETLTAEGGRLAGNRATAEKFKLWIVVSLGTAGVVAFTVYIYANELPIFSVIGLTFFTLFVVGAVKFILSSATEDHVRKPVRKPPGLTRWVDLYASADPVPNGRTRISKAPRARAMSRRIWNRGSILSDHTAYWDNLDGFVLRVVRVCAETAQSPWQDRLPPGTHMNWANRRASWRVDFLRWAMWINALFWLFAFSLLWWQHVGRVPLPFEVPVWLPAWAPTVPRTAVLALLVALAAWATAALLRWPWRRWVRSEQELVLAHDYPANTFPIPLFAMGWVIVVLAALASELADGNEFRAIQLLAGPGEKWPELIQWLTPIILTAMLGFFLTLITLSRRPGPQPPKPPLPTPEKE